MGSIFRTLFTCRDGSFVIAQKPNPALVAFFIFWLISFSSVGQLSQYSGWLAFLAGVYWGLLELFSGVNLFRRMFGLAVIIVLLLGRV